MYLADLLKEIANAGSLAARAASDSSRQRLQDAFRKNDQGVLEPRGERYQIGEGEPVEIADYTLIRSGSLDLKELKVRFEVEADFSDVEIFEEAESEELDATKIRIKPKRGLIDRNTHIEVEATFEMGARPEAAETVSDKLLEHTRLKLEGGV